MYSWEERTQKCRPFGGGPNNICPSCGLQKWQHEVMAFWVCDGSCLLHVLYDPEKDQGNLSWCHRV